MLIVRLIELDKESGKFMDVTDHPVGETEN